MNITNKIKAQLRLCLMLFIPFLVGCKLEPTTTDINTGTLLEAEDYKFAVDSVLKSKQGITIPKDGVAEYLISIPITGRYTIDVVGSSDSGSIWIEDYIFNQDDRTYNITGNISMANSKKSDISTVDGSPMAKGEHSIRIHVVNDDVFIDKLTFKPLLIHDSVTTVLKQEMSGNEWSLVWSDEFDQGSVPDSTKWSYNLGNWGWGNNELQYYTNQPENARIENGQLIIKAIKNNHNEKWTSARLTTQGQVALQYGKIEFRAKVPYGRGTWSAGWLLGESYQDELSWPYCGEIDILECVGYEINDTTKNGLNHATCHTRAYYFKQGNQIGSDTTLEDMTNTFHTYSVEWYPDVIYGLVDGVRYYTYDKNTNELEWPFNNPQNIILNLAIGGGWGGAKGIDPQFNEHEFIIDYVRVYQKK